MNKEKVYLEGYVVGHAADTLGYKGLLVQLENLDVVEIDKNLVHKDINEPQKATIPQFVADYIEESRLKGWDLLASMCFVLNAKNKKTTKWFYLGENKNIFARAWVDGFEIEQEKRYLVKLKGMVEDFVVLKLDKIRDGWYLGNDTEYSYTKVKHTRKELEDAGFGEVFNSPLFEVEEVE